MVAGRPRLDLQRGEGDLRLLPRTFDRLQRPRQSQIGTESRPLPAALDQLGIAQDHAQRVAQLVGGV